MCSIHLYQQLHFYTFLHVWILTNWDKIMVSLHTYNNLQLFTSSMGRRELLTNCCAIVSFNDSNDDSKVFKSFIALSWSCVKLTMFLFSACCWHVVFPSLLYLNLTNIVWQQYYVIKVSCTIVNFDKPIGAIPIHKPLANVSFGILLFFKQT